MTGQPRVRKSPLDPIDRLTEVMFGLFMTLTFTGTMSVTLSAGGTADAGATVNGILLAAIGCNLAWGIVDGTVYVLATVTGRVRAAARIAVIRAAGPDAAVPMVRAVFPEQAGAHLTDPEARLIAGWLRRNPPIMPIPGLCRDDLHAALAVFGLVTGATLPPILPFLLTQDVFLAMRLSNAVAVAMLVVIGWQLDLQMQNGSRTLRKVVPVVGIAMVAITIVLGG